MATPDGAAPRLRAYDPEADAAWLLALNNAHAAEVGETTADHLGRLTAAAFAVRIAERSEGPAGALIGLTRGLDYDSLNYRWFVTRDDAPFLYVDRVIVAPEAKGLGIGRMLYEDAFGLARKAGIARVVCEVNERPPNPVSMAFHERMGFSALETRENAQSSKRVVMMEKRLA